MLPVYAFRDGDDPAAVERAKRRARRDARFVVLRMPVDEVVTRRSSSSDAAPPNGSPEQKHRALEQPGLAARMRAAGSRAARKSRSLSPFPGAPDDARGGPPELAARVAIKVVAFAHKVADEVPKPRGSHHIGTTFAEFRMRRLLSTASRRASRNYDRKAI